MQYRTERSQALNPQIGRNCGFGFKDKDEKPKIFFSDMFQKWAQPKLVYQVTQVVDGDLAVLVWDVKCVQIWGRSILCMSLFTYQWDSLEGEDGPAQNWSLLHESSLLKHFGTQQTLTIPHLTLQPPPPVATAPLIHMSHWSLQDPC